MDIEHHIEDHGNGRYTLFVDGSPVVVIDWLHGVRVCRWQVYGPADLDRAVALMEGFFHLAALIGQEPHRAPPVVDDGEHFKSRHRKEKRK